MSKNFSNIQFICVLVLTEYEVYGILTTLKEGKDMVRAKNLTLDNSINMLPELKQKAFRVLKEFLQPDEAAFLTEALSKLLDEKKFNDYISSPIALIDGEDNILIDRKFLTERFLKMGSVNPEFDIERAKVIVRNCHNVHIKGVDVMFLHNNAIKMIEPEEGAERATTVLASLKNKIRFSVNVQFTYSVQDNFLNMCYTHINNLMGVSIYNMDERFTSEIVCDPKFWPLALNIERSETERGKKTTFEQKTLSPELQALGAAAKSLDAMSNDSMVTA